MIRFLSCLLTVLCLASTTKTWAQTALPTSWNFSTPVITDPPNGWQISNALNGTGGLTYTTAANSFGGDNISARLDATGEFVKIWFADKPGPVSYYIKGTGISPNPPFQGLFSVQESVDDVTYTDLRVFNNANPMPGGAMGAANKFVDNPAPTSRYIRLIFNTKVSGYNVALDSVLIKSAPPSPAASITVKVGTSVVIHQTTYPIGIAPATSFVIQNNGTSLALQIDSVRVTGNAAGDYTIPSIPASVAANSTQIMLVNFLASTTGSRKATLKIYSNDPEKNPYIIQLYGIGGTLATEPTFAPASLLATNATSFGFRLSMAALADAPEKYIILRKKDSDITDTPLDGTSYQVGDNVGGSVVAYIGDSAVTNLRSRYIFANTNYNFKVFSFNGLAGFENYLISSSANATVTTLGKQPGNYYIGINPELPTFVNDLRDKINQHDTVFYSQYAPRLVQNYLSRDTTGGREVVNCVYTGIPYIYNGAFSWWTGQGGNLALLTREHTYAQSWMPSNGGPASSWPNASNGKEFPEYNDMHNLFPAHQINANARRSNNPFGVVVNATYTSPTGVGKVGTNSGGTVVYEPKNDHKGDLARTLMYMSTCYNGVQGQEWKFPSNQSPAIIMQWHQQDPPSNLEIARHEYIFSLQKNRNPFIDNPEWASSINFATMGYLPTAVNPLEFRNSIATWPNPSADRINVDATLFFQPSMKYDWVNANGQVQGSGTIQAPITQLQLPESKGVYFLRIYSDTGVRVARVMKD